VVVFVVGSSIVVVVLVEVAVVGIVDVSSGRVVTIGNVLGLSPVTLI
jgi:hypothetical protein